ncbi:uncharacterized protein LOC120342573 [Styela clava]
MEYELLLVSLLVLFFGLTTTSGCIVERENSCTCDPTMRQVSCTRLGDSVDDVLPHLIPDETWQLVMKRVWVDDAVELRPHNFVTLKQLRWLDFSYNRISVIHPETFSDMRSLYFVNLSHNRLRLLESNAFNGNLPDLLSLDLSYNRLLLLTERNFKAVKNLKFLDLRNNPILFISGEAFWGLSQLERLKLSSANFTKFPAEPLSSLLNLRMLEMRDMPFIKSIPDHAFSFNSRLESLVLEKLPLSVGGLSVDVFYGLESLRHMTIASCNLTSVPCTSLSNVKHSLESLDLSRNSIQIIYPDDLSGLSDLKNLTLHDTHLQEIKPGSFIKLEKLEALDLSNNRLRTLYQDSFPENLTKLQEIRLTNNVWSCDCSLKWLTESHISLGHDHVTCTDPRSERGKSLKEMRKKLPDTFYKCKSPIITTKEYSEERYVEGDQALLYCDGSGEPLSFSWYFAGTVIPVRGSDLRKNGKELTIRNVQLNDAGEYTCIIRNAGGQKSITVLLHVDAAKHGDMSSNLPPGRGNDGSVKDSGKDCSTGTQNIRREFSRKPGFSSENSFDKTNIATTAILITILGCVTTLGVAGVFLFVGCVWSKRRDAAGQNSRNTQNSAPSVNVNGHCKHEQSKNASKKTMKSIELTDERVVFGGHGIYSKPIQDLDCPKIDRQSNINRKK